MTIITIAHEAFGDGRQIAEHVASILNYRCISREVLVKASERYGIAEAKLIEVLEERPHHWWVPISGKPRVLPYRAPGSAMRTGAGRTHCLSRSCWSGIFTWHPSCLECFCRYSSEIKNKTGHGTERIH